MLQFLLLCISWIYLYFFCVMPNVRSTGNSPPATTLLQSIRDTQRRERSGSSSYRGHKPCATDYQTHNQEGCHMSKMLEQVQLLLLILWWKKICFVKVFINKTKRVLYKHMEWLALTTESALRASSQYYGQCWQLPKSRVSAILVEINKHDMSMTI